MQNDSAHAGGRPPRDLPVRRDVVQPEAAPFVSGYISPSAYEEQLLEAA